MTIRRATSAILLALAAILASCGEREKDRLALVGGNVVDLGDGTVMQNAVVVIYKGHIETVAPAGFKIPKSAVVLDVSGRYLIPGLIDAHAHVKRWALARYIAYGVTTVRDIHGTEDSVMALRESLIGGSLSGGQAGGDLERQGAGGLAAQIHHSRGRQGAHRTGGRRGSDPHL